MEAPKGCRFLRIRFLGGFETEAKAKPLFSGLLKQREQSCLRIPFLGGFEREAKAKPLFSGLLKQRESPMATDISMFDMLLLSCAMFKGACTCSRRPRSMFRGSGRKQKTRPSSSPSCSRVLSGLGKMGFQELLASTSKGNHTAVNRP